MTARERWAASAVHRTITLGDAEISYLPDGRVELAPQGWFTLPDLVAFDSVPELLTPSGYLTGSIGSLLIRTPDWVVLIDAGYGPRKLSREQSHPSLGELTGGGLADHTEAFADVDAVLFTHLHDDHTGWAMAGWPGTSLTERPHLAGVLEAPSSFHGVSDGEQIFPGLTALASPGHTRGHTSYLIDRGGEQLLVFGDAMHSPIQVARPELNSCFEADPSSSVKSRAQTLEYLSQPGVVGAGVHFADVVFGTTADNAWHPLDG
ncbi:MBL fold metallo-hydrolase [Streptomyces sp. SID13031]|uniref:MBL fold metallo-hydrolase n=1 Tax=Streptomyces sp. SID13031 TaxID=2706046 RepID=UPI0013C649FB|nr:MBL fold metallo-hydrolase [Streptomyces sp. SID13031]